MVTGPSYLKHHTPSTRIPKFPAPKAELEPTPEPALATSWFILSRANGLKGCPGVTALETC